MQPPLRKPQCLVYVLACFALNARAAILGQGDAGSFELLVLHNNDMHARFEQTSRRSGLCGEVAKQENRCYGGFARVATLVREARAAAAQGVGPPVLYLNAGDTYTGTAWFNLYKWQVAAAFINELKPDAVSLGNHEFDNGVSGLTPFIESISCPVVTSNIILTEEPELARERNLKPYVILNVEGTPVGVIGYLTPETKFLSKQNKVKYIDEVVAIKREVDILKSKNIKIIIALGHSGFETDLRIAKEVDGVDLVIGGHTNTFLWNGTSPDAEKVEGPYPSIVQQKSGKMVPVVQAYAYTKYLGRLNMVFDSQGEMISYSGSPILLDGSVPEDKEVAALVDQYRTQVHNITEEIVGSTGVLLDGDTFSCRLHECNMGNLITDAMVYYYADKYNGTQWTDAPIAIIQGGGIRASIDASENNEMVKVGDLLAVLPFESQIIKLTMSGKALRTSLEMAVDKYTRQDARGCFLQVSGLTIVYDLTREPGSRVVSVSARCWECSVPKDEELKPDRMYNILMPLFLSEGGDGFFLFNNDSLPREEMPYDELHCLTEYIKNRSPVYPVISGRVKVLGLDSDGNVKQLSSPSSAAVNIATTLLYPLLLVMVRLYR